MIPSIEHFLVMVVKDLSLNPAYGRPLITISCNALLITILNLKLKSM